MKKNKTKKIIFTILLLILQVMIIIVFIKGFTHKKTPNIPNLNQNQETEK